jgi:hypothetical protein
MKKGYILAIATFVGLSFGSLAVSAQKKNGAKQPVAFFWNNPPEKWTLKDLPPNFSHAYFKSPSMGLKVGYYVYLPSGYNEPNSKKNILSSTIYTAGGLGMKRRVSFCRLLCIRP